MMFRESNKGKVVATILATFPINVFFLIFHVNIQNKNGIFQHKNQTIN